MIVFRLSKEKYKDDLTGKGAEQSGGRWNSKGNALVYTSESRSLCTTEVAVHIPLGNIPFNYCLVTIEIPDDAEIMTIQAAALPPDWASLSHPGSTQAIGDKFLKDGKFLVLKVPSAVVQGDFNYLINPAHKKASSIKVVHTEPFNFDPRLFR